MCMLLRSLHAHMRARMCLCLPAELPVPDGQQIGSATRRRRCFDPPPHHTTQYATGSWWHMHVPSCQKSQWLLVHALLPHAVGSFAPASACTCYTDVHLPVHLPVHTAPYASAPSSAAPSLAGSRMTSSTGRIQKKTTIASPPPHTRLMCARAHTRLLYTYPSPRDESEPRMPSSA